VPAKAFVTRLRLQRAVNEWLADGMDNPFTATVAKYRNVLKPQIAALG
jgi:hypothetical protein